MVKASILDEGWMQIWKILVSKYLFVPVTWWLCFAYKRFIPDRCLCLCLHVHSGCWKESAFLLYWSHGSNLGNPFFWLLSIVYEMNIVEFSFTNTLWYASLYLGQCFFPQNLINNVKTPLFILNAAYDVWQVCWLSPLYVASNKSILFFSWISENVPYFAICFQIQSSLAPSTADPHHLWGQCKMNHAHCSAEQLQFLQSKSFALIIVIIFWSLKANLWGYETCICTDFRMQMLHAVKVFSRSPANGLFINSCFAHCQSERQDTWFADDSPVVQNKVHKSLIFFFFPLM